MKTYKQFIVLITQIASIFLYKIRLTILCFDFWRISFFKVKKSSPPLNSLYGCLAFAPFLMLLITIYINWDELISFFKPSFLSSPIFIISVLLFSLYCLRQKNSKISIEYLYKKAINNIILKEKISEFEKKGSENLQLYELLNELYSPIFEKPLQFKSQLTVYDLKNQEYKWAAIYIEANSKTNFENVLEGEGKKLKSIKKPILNTSPYDMKTAYRSEEEKMRYPDSRTGNNLTLRGIDIGESENVMIKPGVGTYGHIMDSSDSLLREAYLFSKICSEGFGKIKINLKPWSALLCMPWRRNLHKVEGSIYNVLFKPRYRAAGLGVACLTCFKNSDGNYERLLIKRGEKVGTYPGEFHVVPAGMANIKGDSFESNEIKKIVELEFLEELFEYDDFERADLKYDNEASLEKYTKKELYGKDNENNTSLHITGIAIDLLNLRPEICVLALIKSELWELKHKPDKIDQVSISKKKFRQIKQRNYSKLDKGNYEIKEFAKKNLLNKDQTLEDDLNEMAPHLSVQSGCVAYFLGSKKLRELV